MKKGFSLIELMVVIAIVALLSAAALPAYKNYLIKTKIVSAVPIVQSINAKLLERFDINGALPSSVTIGTATISNNAQGVFYAPPVERAVFYNGFSNIPIENLLTCVYIAGLEGMTPSSGAAYVAPTASITGTRNRLCIYNIPSNGVFEQYCGIWTAISASGGDLYLPPEYLPNNCNCTALNTGTC